MKAKGTLIVTLCLEAVFSVFLLLVGPNPSGALKVAAQRLESETTVASLESTKTSLAEVQRWVALAISGHDFQVGVTVVVLLTCILLQLLTVFLNRSKTTGDRTPDTPAALVNEERKPSN